MIHSRYARWRGGMNFCCSGQHWGGVPRYPALPLRGGALSVQAISWVLTHSKSKLGARLVLLSIANHARDDGTGAWPSIATLTKESLMSEREVRYCLRSLERCGELQTQIRCGPYGTNMYSLPQMVGAKSAPCRDEGGAICNTNRGNLLHKEGQWVAPNPSLTVLKDKDMVSLAIMESHQSGEDADVILKRQRKKAGL